MGETAHPRSSQPFTFTVRERVVRPPRLVSVFIGDNWMPGQVLAWRISRGDCRFLVQPVTRTRRKAGAMWVDATLVRPREDPMASITRSRLTRPQRRPDEQPDTVAGS